MAKKKEIVDGKIECGRCKIWKDLNDENFYQDKSGKTPSICIDCRNEYSKQWFRDKKLIQDGRMEKKPRAQDPKIIDGKKHCGGCDEWKLLNEENFYLLKKGKRSGKFSTICRECSAESTREYRKKNPREKTPEQIEKEKDKMYKKMKKEEDARKRKEEREAKKAQKLAETKEQKAAKQKIAKQRYLNKNRDRINSEYRQRIKNDIPFRLHKMISRQIGKSLEAVGSSKAGKSISKFLPYTFDDLVKHIESKFESWMTWDNHGIYRIWDDNDSSTWRWHIDHIIPQSDLPFSSMEDENFKKCWALDNLRPLSAKQNLIDGATRVRHNKINQHIDSEITNNEVISSHKDVMTTNFTKDQ